MIKISQLLQQLSIKKIMNRTKTYQLLKINNNDFDVQYSENNISHISYLKINDFWYLDGNKAYTIKSDAEAVITRVENQEKLNIQNFKTNFIDKNITVWTVENYKLESVEFNTIEKDDKNITTITTIEYLENDNRTETYQLLKINNNYFDVQYSENNISHISYLKINDIWYLDGNKAYTTKSDAEGVLKKIEDRENDIKTLINNKIENFKNNFIDKNVTVWTIKNSKLKSWEFLSRKDMNLTNLIIRYNNFN